MSPHQPRGPDGRFVESSDIDGRWKRVEGGLSAIIPAADLSGGTTDQPDLDGDIVQLIDFSGELESHEAFHVVRGWFQTQLMLHTTATTEGWARADVAYSRESAASDHSSAFLTVNEEDDVWDVNQSFVGEVSEHLHRADLMSENNFNDTTSATGGGGWVDTDRTLVQYQPGEFVFDQDDEVYSPLSAATDNIDDHAIEIRAEAFLTGIVEEGR